MRLIIFMMVIKSGNSLAIFSHTKQHMGSLLIYTPTLPNPKFIEGTNENFLFQNVRF